MDLPYQVVVSGQEPCPALRAGALFHLRMRNGEIVRRLDPVTMRETPDAAVFVVADDGLRQVV